MSRVFIFFVRKEFLHIFRDVRTMVILLGIPVVQLILFGFAISTEVKNARIAVLDLSRDAASRAVTERLDASAYFDVGWHLEHPGDVEKVFREGKAPLVVVFSERFQQQMLHSGSAGIQLIADASDPNYATTLTRYAEAIIADFERELQASDGVAADGLSADGQPGSTQAAAPQGIVPQLTILYNPRLQSAYQFVPGVLGMILMLICAMMTAISIVREKETGTMEVLLVSPVRPILIILAKAVPYFVLSCVNLATVLLLSVFVLGVPVAGSLVWLVLVSFLFVFVSLSLGLLVSTLTRSQVVAMLISGMSFMLPVVLLSGMMFPVEHMPRVLQMLSHMIPAKWFIIVVKDLMIKGAGISAALPEVLVLCGMAVVFVTLSLLNFKHRLE